MDAIYKLEGMHCGACVGRIQKAFDATGVKADVTLSPPEVRISGGALRSVGELATTVEGAGRYKLGAAVPAASTTATADSAVPELARPKSLATWLETYQPLLVILAYIAIASLAGTGGTSSAASAWAVWMTNFMAGFFLVFSFFKFLDLAGFADAYSTYDLLAQKWRPWGYIYPFLELGLGLAYLFRVAPFATNLAAILLMSFSSLGVIAALRRRQTIRCACLGTVLKLPMSTITLVEDLGMVAMAAMALFLGH
jgi:copper chaperone CopZ